MRAGRTLPLLQYVVTLAIVEAVQALAAEALGPQATAAAAAAAAAAGGRGDGGGRVGPCPLDVRIKWPNDVYGSGLKARRAVLLQALSVHTRIRAWWYCGVDLPRSPERTLRGKSGSGSCLLRMQGAHPEGALGLCRFCAWPSCTGARACSACADRSVPMALQVGGVLCQSSYVDGAFLVTIGVGLNVSNSQPSTYEA